MGKGRERGRRESSVGFSPGWGNGMERGVWVLVGGKGISGDMQGEQRVREGVRSLEVTEMGPGAERVMAEMSLGTACAGWRSLKGEGRISNQ
ncbi:hypothetical protein AAC387_Pa03g0542 [Persea americana]